MLSSLFFFNLLLFSSCYFGFFFFHLSYLLLLLGLKLVCYKLKLVLLNFLVLKEFVCWNFGAKNASIAIDYNRQCFNNFHPLYSLRPNIRDVYRECNFLCTVISLLTAKPLFQIYPVASTMVSCTLYFSWSNDFVGPILTKSIPLYVRDTRYYWPYKVRVSLTYSSCFSKWIINSRSHQIYLDFLAHALWGQGRKVRRKIV